MVFTRSRFRHTFGRDPNMEHISSVPYFHDFIEHLLYQKPFQMDMIQRSSTTMKPTMKPTMKNIVKIKQNIRYIFQLLEMLDHTTIMYGKILWFGFWTIIYHGYPLWQSSTFLRRCFIERLSQIIHLLHQDETFRYQLFHSLQQLSTKKRTCPESTIYIFNYWRTIIVRSCK